MRPTKLLSMNIPPLVPLRADSREAIFFQHGVLDTSMGWVSNGVDGSQAFAAYDRGCDVWLGNTRANPPRAHTDATRSAAEYWCYTINELGTEDVAAQIDWIHKVKMYELGRGGGGILEAGIVGGSAAGGAAGQHSPRPGL